MYKNIFICGERVRSYIFEKKQQEIELAGYLNERQPLLIELGELERDFRIPLIIKKGKSFRGVSSGETGISYFSKSHVLPPSQFVLFENEGSYTFLYCLSGDGSISGGADEWLLTSGCSYLCVEGSDPYTTVKLAMRYATQLGEEEPAQPKEFDTLGWDSSLSYGKYSTEEKILNAVWGLRQQGMQPGFVTIGDGWQNRSKGFDADPENFPLGLKGLVEELHRAGVKDVGVQINPEKLKGKLGKCFEFFNEYFQYLKKQGVSYLKGVTLNDTILTAMRGAAPLYFERYACSLKRVITPDPLVGIRDRLINSLWLQMDYGSWVSGESNQTTLAMFHALSGSSIVIGDLPGKADSALLKKIILPNGKALRTDQHLTVCRDSLFTDPCSEEVVYKAFTRKSEIGIVGAFNLHTENKTVFGTVSPSDIEGIISEKCVVYSDRNGILGVVTREERLEVILKPNQSDIFTFVPLEKRVALIGCTPFFLTYGPIREVIIEEDSIRFSSDVTSPIVLYSEKEVFEVRKNGSTVPWEYDSKHQTLTIDPNVEAQSITASFCVLFE